MIHPASSFIKQAFLEALFSVHPLDDDTMVFIEERLQVHRKEKGDMLLPFGAICDKLYFVYSGLAR